MQSERVAVAAVGWLVAVVAGAEAELAAGVGLQVAAA